MHQLVVDVVVHPLLRSKRSLLIPKWSKAPTSSLHCRRGSKSIPEWKKAPSSSLHCRRGSKNIPEWKKAPSSSLHCQRWSCCCGIPHLLITSCPGCRLTAGIVLEWGPDWGRVVHNGSRLGKTLLATGNVAAAVGVVVAAGEEGGCLPPGRVVGGRCPGLGVVEADVVDAVALPRGGALQPAVVFLRVAGDLHRRPGLDEVSGDVLPVAAAEHAQPTEELPVDSKNKRSVSDTQNNYLDPADPRRKPAWRN
jgi:hypothetical protein